MKNRTDGIECRRTSLLHHGIRCRRCSADFVPRNKVPSDFVVLCGTWFRRPELPHCCKSRTNDVYFPRIISSSVTPERSTVGRQAVEIKQIFRHSMPSDRDAERCSLCSGALLNLWDFAEHCSARKGVPSVLPGCDGTLFRSELSFEIPRFRVSHS
jgi:hypothetical protein